MENRFRIQWVVENGYPHYKITDVVNSTTIHCDEGELNTVLYELIGEN